MYVCMYVCMYLCMYVCTCLSIYLSICLCMYACMHAMYIYIYIHVCLCIWTCLCICMCICVCVCICICALLYYCPVFQGFYRSICTRDGFEHEALEKLGHLIAVVHVDGFLMFGSTPAFTDAVTWSSISADQNHPVFRWFWYTTLVPGNSDRQNMDWLALRDLGVKRPH